MITKDEISEFAKKLKINEAVIVREYIQLLWLSKLYTRKESKGVFFKGGTAVHLIYKAPRFSEDLDFTVNLKKNAFDNLLRETYKEVSYEINIKIKERKTLAGKKFLLTFEPKILAYEVFVSLDFSFREKAVSPQKSIIETGYPVLFTSFINHLSKEEILAEKIRAILTRKKGRDIYDLWYLVTQGTNFSQDLVRKKLKYYKLDNIKSRDILDRIETFS